MVQVKVFGSLVKGLRIGLDLLMLLQNEGHIISSLSKVFKLPMLSGSNGLDQFLAQFEAAVDSDFPKYQVMFLYACTFFYRRCKLKFLLSIIYLFILFQFLMVKDSCDKFENVAAASNGLFLFEFLKICMI